MNMKNFNSANETESPPKKKLKQTRLSFQGAQKSEVKISENCIKRKSVNFEEESKKPCPTPSECHQIVVSDDDEVSTSIKISTIGSNVVENLPQKHERDMGKNDISADAILVSDDDSPQHYESSDSVASKIMQTSKKNDFINKIQNTNDDVSKNALRSLSFDETMECDEEVSLRKNISSAEEIISDSEVTQVDQCDEILAVGNNEINTTVIKAIEDSSVKSLINAKKHSTGKTNKTPDKVIKNDPTTPKTFTEQAADIEAITPNVAADKESNQSLTPKQLQRKLGSAKKKEEKEQERLEKERRKNQEKEDRARQKLEKEEQKRKEREEKEEMKRKEKEDREELKRKEKEEKELQREKERKERDEKEDAKRREKEAKEEEKRKKLEMVEEEKRKKELEKEEAEMRKKKAAEAFANFFVARKSQRIKENNPDSDVPKVTHDYLSSFAVKIDMRVAPVVRRKLDSNQKRNLEKYIESQTDKLIELYLSIMKTKNIKLISAQATWPLEDIKDEVTIIEPDEDINLPGANFVVEETKREKLRPKFLSFCENRRPPYWGTWRKKNKAITGRTPFRKDENVFDYSCDSDEEWEDDEPGESIEGSVAGSDDEVEADEYEVDNEFFVPHGYLSDEEAVGEDDTISMSPETQKAKLKYMEDEFVSEHKKPTERLKPRLFGIIWERVDCSKPENLPETIWNYLGRMEMLTSEYPVDLKPVGDKKDFEDDCENNTERLTSKKPRSINAAMIPDLVRLLHGNTNNKMFLAKEFQAFICKSENGEATNEEVQNAEPQKVSKLSIRRKIKELSKWTMYPEEGVMCGKYCWYVDKEIRNKYGHGDLQTPNSWSYILEPTSRSDNIRKKTPKSSPKVPHIKTKPTAKCKLALIERFVTNMDVPK